VQNETLNATAIYSADEDLFKFISVGRDGETEQACEEIDFVIIRFDISSQDAMEILDLLLTCLVNETTNETAKTYSYVSTKHNGTTATMMNLPHSVLNLISWFCNFSDSEQGSKPKGFKDWLLAPLTALANMIVGVFITIGMAFVELFAIMIDFFATILMDILPILAYILWLIIRVLLLIFIWIMFIITLVLVLTLFLGISTTMVVLSTILDFDMKIKPNRITSTGDLSLKMGYIIGKEYNSYLALNIPTIETYFESEKVKFDFNFSLNSFYIGFTKFPKQVINTTLTDWLSFFTSMGGIMGLCAGGFGIMSVAAHSILSTGGSSFSILNALWVANLVLSIDGIFNSLTNAALVKPAMIGMGIGFMIASVAVAFPFLFTGIGESMVFLTTGVYSGAQLMMSLKEIVLTLSGYGVFIKLLEELNEDLKRDELDYLGFKCLFALTSSCLGLTLASYAIQSVPLIIFRILLAVFTLCLGVIFLTGGLAAE
jgi:hypothetical protein